MLSKNKWKLSHFFVQKRTTSNSDPHSGSGALERIRMLTKTVQGRAQNQSSCVKVSLARCHFTFGIKIANQLTKAKRLNNSTQ